MLGRGQDRLGARGLGPEEEGLGPLLDQEVERVRDADHEDQGRDEGRHGVEGEPQEAHRAQGPLVGQEQDPDHQDGAAQGAEQEPGHHEGDQEERRSEGHQVVLDRLHDPVLDHGRARDEELGLGVGLLGAPDHVLEAGHDSGVELGSSHAGGEALEADDDARRAAVLAEQGPLDQGR